MVNRDTLPIRDHHCGPLPKAEGDILTLQSLPEHQLVGLEVNAAEVGDERLLGEDFELRELHAERH
jgi:hypothetical protein